MSIETYLAYLLALLIAVASPGPAMIAVMSMAARGGVRQGLVAGAGVAGADVLLAAAALLGLAALMMAFEPALLVVKWVGGGYLIWIGIRMWREAGKHEDSAGPSGRPLWTGFAVGLSNPKAVLFHASLMPLVIDIARLTPIAAAIIVLTVLAINLAVMGLYAAAAWRGSARLRSPSGQRLMGRVGGGAMIGAGAAVVTR